VKVRDVIRVLEAHGWRLERQCGRQRIFRRDAARKPNTEIPPGTLGSIRRRQG
jgi:predicted RNA binding protein YcfA (HicA-like mRNA interferase family)